MEEQPNFETDGNESQQLANILRGFGEEHGFDDETCEEIAVMPFEEAFETTYGYLSQSGLDPHEVLTNFMQEPEE